MSATEIVLADPESLQDLGTYAARARRILPDGAVRLQAVGSVLAAWVCARESTGLLGEGLVLGLRTFALAEPVGASGGDGVDATVPLQAVNDRTSRPGVGARFSLPPTRLTPPWTAITPPRGPWVPLGVVEADGLLQLARAERERLAVQTDAGPVVLNRPVGVAAHGLGFLRPGAEVSVHRCGGWTRLTAPGGYVLIR